VNSTDACWIPLIQVTASYTQLSSDALWSSHGIRCLAGTVTNFRKLVSLIAWSMIISEVSSSQGLISSFYPSARFLAQIMQTLGVY